VKGGNPLTGFADPSWPRPAVPDLSGLEVSVFTPEPVEPLELVTRLLQLRVDRASKTPLKSGEVLEAGDLAVVEVIGFAKDGKMVELAFKDLELVAGWPSSIFGLGEAVVGRKVGEEARLDLSVPVWMRIKSGARLELPEFNEAFFGELGRGATLADVMDSLAAEAEAVQRTQTEAEATRRVLSMVAARAKPEVSEHLIDIVIGWHWQQGQGAVMKELGRPLAEQDAALHARLNHPQTRADAHEQLAVSMTMRAIAEAKGLVVEPLEETSGEFDSQQLSQQLTHLRAVAFVMENAAVKQTDVVLFP
jgi:FKBP-type peptidyl-prolyl cis-trans isomerase (trigger factor)